MNEIRLKVGAISLNHTLVKQKRHYSYSNVFFNSIIYSVIPNDAATGFNIALQVLCPTIPS